MPKDLAYLKSIGFKPDCVLSANDHGFKQDLYDVDYIVCVDNMHSEKKKPVYDVMKPYGVPLISRFWWGDYRLVDWKCHVNSGMTAFIVGALMGGKPVVVTGVDGWGPVTYFHNPDIKVACSNRPQGYVTKQLRRAYDGLAPCDVVRPMSGLMIGMYKAFDPTEQFAPGPNKLTYGQILKSPKRTLLHRVTALETFTWELSNTPKGESFLASSLEVDKIYQAQRTRQVRVERVNDSA